MPKAKHLQVPAACFICFSCATLGCCVPKQTHRQWKQELMRILRSPLPPLHHQKGKRKVISIFHKKSFHLLPVLGMEASSAMDRLPPCGHRRMWASAGNHRARNAPGSKPIQLPPAMGQQAKCCAAKAVMRLTRVELAVPMINKHA